MVADLAAPSLEGGLIALWGQAWLHAGVPAEQVARMSETFRKEVAVLPPDEVAAIVASGGFDEPVRCFQSILIHGWLARRTASP